MLYSLTTVLALVASAASLNVPRQACSFTLTSSGGRTGSLGQLGDGQVRVGGNYATSTFSINNGRITDANGRGCILTPPTTQFQCDVGATPTSGFSIACTGLLAYNGNTQFYACPATETEYNIYTVPVAGQTKCVAVTLTASSCFSPCTVTQTLPAVTRTVTPPAVTVTSVRTTTVVPACPAPSTVTNTMTRTVQPTCPAPVTVTNTATRTVTVSPVAPAPVTTTTIRVTTPTPTPTAKVCPANLSGPYQFPHLIIPVDSTKPNTAAGTSYFGTITSTVSSIFNFDIPASYTGTCSLVFLFPEQRNLQTSSFTFSGPGTVDFVQLATVATQATTFANQGAVRSSFGTFTVRPGTSTVVTTFACPAGQAVSYEIRSVGGTSLTYFQDYNPSPIGLYVTTC